MSSELHWIVGPERAAVRRRESRIFSLWPRPTDHDRVPMGLHMALARPDDELYSDPMATRRLVAVALPSVPIPIPVGLGLVVAAVCAVLVASQLGPGAWVGLPDRTIATASDLAGVLLFATVGYALASFWEAGLCAAQLERSERCFGLGAKGPSVEPAVWRLGLPATCAVLAVTGPIALSGVLLAWGHAWPALASGAATGSLLYAMRICLPLRPGPVTRLLGPLVRVPDFFAALRWSLTTQFLPAPQRSSGRRPELLAVGAVALLAWVVIAGTALPLLVSPDVFRSFVVAEASTSEASSGSDPGGAAAESESDRAAAIARAAQLASWPSRSWRVVMSVVSVAVLLWLIESMARLFRYALLFGGRVEREPVSPSPAARSFWARESALCRHVPAIAKLPWQWTRAASGTLLVRQGDADRSFHWLASGEARVVSRDDVGDLHQLAILRGGSGVGEMALLEDRPRSADVVVVRTALVVSLSYEDFTQGTSQADRDHFAEVVLAGRAFATSPVFRGCPPSDKERWIRAGTPSRHRPGETIIAEGGTDRWMGLIVDGEIEVRQHGEVVASLASGAVFGEVAFLYERARNASLVATADVLLWAWEPEWLADEVVRTGVESDLVALAEKRGAPGRR